MDSDGSPLRLDFVKTIEELFTTVWEALHLTVGMLSYRISNSRLAKQTKPYRMLRVLSMDIVAERVLRLIEQGSKLGF